MKKLFKNPVSIIVFLTFLMSLPFFAFLFDKYLFNLSNPFLLLGELFIIFLGITSGFIIFKFFFK